MTEFVRYRLDDGSTVLVEASTNDGVTLTGRAGKTFDAASSLADSLAGVRKAANETLRQFRDGVNGPETIEVEFGVALNAQAGAIIARTGVEGHIKIKLTWEKPHEEATPEA